MKRNLLTATALALTVISANAQSTVTIGGYADGSILLESGGATGSLRKLGSGASGPSRLYFRGTEDLGGGMSSFFHLETGVLLDTGSSLQQNFFGRQSYVGVGGGWGNVKLGLQYTPLFTTVRDIGDPFRTGSMPFCMELDLQHRCVVSA